MVETEVKAIRGGRLIDGTGAAPVENAVVLLKGSQITAAGPHVEIPPQARVIDATGMTLMPGLIDAHLHVSGAKSNALVESMVRPRELALIKSKYDCQDLLMAGFTMAKCCGGRNAVFLKKAVAEGTVKGIPRLVAAGLGLSQTFGHGDVHYYPVEWVDPRTSSQPKGGLICDGVDECIKATRYALRFGADFIKICTTGGVMSEKDLPSDVQMNLDEIRAIVQTAAQVGKYVTSHTQNSWGTKNAVLGGVKTLDHCNETSDEVIELIKEHDCIAVTTLAIARQIIDHGAEVGMAPWGIAKAKTQWEMMAETYQRMLKAGVTIAAGTDYGGSPLMQFGRNAVELELLVKYSGFTPMDTIVAATRNAAKACFMGDETGTIEPGKLADILVVDGDPLADITILQNAERIKMVMLEGNVEVNRGI